MTTFLIQDFITHLLVVVESLERAVNTEVKTDDIDSYRQGIQLVYQQFMAILGERGLTRVESVGQKFDPNLHEAVQQIPSDEHEPGTVIAEFSPGYMLKERVIKAPKVQVAAAKTE